jgi:hypothetical protein
VPLEKQARAHDSVATKGHIEFARKKNEGRRAISSLLRIGRIRTYVTLLGINLGFVSWAEMLPKIPFSVKFGLLDEVHWPLF